MRAWKEAPCVVALGDPHLGKSSALRDYVAQLGQTVSADRIVAQNLADFQSTTELQQQVFRSAAVESWTSRTDTVWLVLDSLDEVRMRMDTVAGVLLEELQALFARLTTARLRVVIACRPLVVPPWFLEGLRDVVETVAGGANAPASRPAADAEEADDNSAEWAEAPPRESTSPSRVATEFDTAFIVLNLMLLTKSDAERAATTYLGSAAASASFLHAVRAVHVGAFAARPATLRALLQRFQHQNVLERDQVQLYRALCLELCTVAPDARDAATSRGDRYRVAARLCAAVLFGNFDGVQHDGPADTSDQFVDTYRCDGTEFVDHGLVRVAALDLSRAACRDRELRNG